MLTRPTPVVPLWTAATPTMAQSWARRLNFWNDQPAPAALGTLISVRISFVGQRRLQEALEEVVGGDLALPVGPDDGERGVEGQHHGRQVRGRVAVGDAAADGPPVPDLGIADLAGGVGQERQLAGPAARWSRRRGGGSGPRWRCGPPPP